MTDLSPDSLTDIGETLNDLATQLREPGSLRRSAVDNVALVLNNIAEELGVCAKRLAETPEEQRLRETHEVAVKAASGQRRPKDRLFRGRGGEIASGLPELGKHR